MSFTEVKALVQKDYERMNAFSHPTKFKLVTFEENEKRDAISYFDLQDPETKEIGLILPEGISSTSAIASSECRYNGKFPTLSFIFQKSGNQIWRCSELRPKQIGSEEQKEDIALISKLGSNKDQKLQIYSARDQSTRTEDTQFGFETTQTYKNIEKHFYSLSSKVKLVRAFE